MSSLQCPTRVFVARHGEAEYESELLSDAGGSLTAAGRSQSRALAQSLRGARIARIWSSSMARAVQTAEIVAADLAVDVVVREGLREFGVGAHAGRLEGPEAFRPVFERWMDGDRDVRIEGGERVADFVARVTGVLEEAADQHRGEAILVVSHGGAILSAVPDVLGLPPGWARGRSLRACGVVELEVDDDGWRAVSWDGA